MSNPVETFAPTTTPHAVGQSDLSANIQKEMIMHRQNACGGADLDQSAKPFDHSGVKIKFKQNGELIIPTGHGANGGFAADKHLVIPPSASIYQKNPINWSHIKAEMETGHGEKLAKFRADAPPLKSSSADVPPSAEANQFGISVNKGGDDYRAIGKATLLGNGNVLDLPNPFEIPPSSNKPH